MVWALDVFFRSEKICTLILRNFKNHFTLFFLFQIPGIEIWASWNDPLILLTSLQSFLHFYNTSEKFTLFYLLTFYWVFVSSNIYFISRNSFLFSDFFLFFLCHVILVSEIQYLFLFLWRDYMFFRFAGLCMVSVSYTLLFSSGFGLCLSLYRQSSNVLCSLSILLQVQWSTKELLGGTGPA